MRTENLEPEHILFRDAFRKFTEQEIAPDYPQWEKDGMVPRELFQKAGALGFFVYGRS